MIKQKEEKNRKGSSRFSCANKMHSEQMWIKSGAKKICKQKTQVVQQVAESDVEVEREVQRSLMAQLNISAMSLSQRTNNRL